MAEAEESRLWHHDYNETSQNNIVDHEDLQALLMDNIQMLAKNMELSDDFWKLLLMGGVINNETSDYIKARKTKMAQSLGLLNSLMDCKVYQMHTFFWALVNSGQYALVKQLNLSINDYLDIYIFMKSSTFRCPCCHEAYTIAYLLTGCGHYVCRPCVKASKFTKTVDEKEEITCPIADCGQITVASPSEENIGLDEDETFTDLCQMVDSTEAGAELPIQEEEALKQAMKVKAEIQAKLTHLENHKKALTEQKNTIEQWYHTNMDKCASVQIQLVKVIQQSAHWMKVVDDLSVLLTARPELKNGMKLPQLSLSSDSIKLMNELMSGCSVEELKTQIRKIPVQPHPNPSFKSASLQCEWQPNDAFIYEVFWTSSGHLMVFKGRSWWQLTLDDAATQVTSVTSVYDKSASGFWMGRDGTWTCCENETGIVEIHKLWEQEIKQWHPAYVSHPCRAVVGTDYIYVINRNSDILRKYNMNMELIFEQHLDILKPSGSYIAQMDICKGGNLLIWNYNDVVVYIVSPYDQVMKCQTSRSQCQLVAPISVCEGPDESILIIDSKHRLSVFNSEGGFLYQVNIEGIGSNLRSASVWTRSGRPALLAVTGCSSQTQCSFGSLIVKDDVHIYALK